MSSTNRLAFVTFDVFTQTPFQGNPLAIVKVSKGQSLSQEQKQAIAREFNFSETVFLHEGELEGSSRRSVDIFTTTEELPFAGHPTIGTICSIATDPAFAATEELILVTKAGPIQSAYNDMTSSAKAKIPHNVHIHQDRLERSRVEQLQPLPDTNRNGSLLALWPYESDGSRSTFPVVSIVKGMTFILVELPRDSEHLRSLRADRQSIYANALKLDEKWLPSFVAPYFYETFSDDGQSVEIHARMMEPGVGEDPATGSAACSLGAYLALQRGSAGQTYRFSIKQGVTMGRPSEIGVEVTLNETGKAIEEIWLSGNAVKVMEGSIML